MTGTVQEERVVTKEAWRWICQVGVKGKLLALLKEQAVDLEF